MSLRPPPSAPVRWIATVVHSGPIIQTVYVTAQTWFQARDLACALLNCGREQVEVQETGGAP